MSPGETSDIAEHVSAVPSDATLERLAAAIARAGLTLFGRFDHQAGAREAGLAMPPATVATPLAALDLPLRVLVRVRDDGRTAIAFHAIRAVLRRAAVPDPLAARFDSAQQLLVDAVAL